MRLLLVHNFYGSPAPSGENRVVLEERDLLRGAGHEVLEHFTYSDSVRDRGLAAMIRTGLAVPWNPAARRRLRRRVRELAPDVMHVHNVFPLLSPSVFSAAADTRTAVVSTLHNYRTVCPGALMLRDGSVCAECVDRRSVLPAVFHGCYRGSRAATLPPAVAAALHRRIRTYARHVDVCIALTDFQKSLLVRGGFPRERVHVKPNCFTGTARVIPWAEREDIAVFVGRVSEEKGVRILLEAWARWGTAAPRLEIIGGGPELECLRRSAPDAIAGKIAFLGPRPAAEAHALLSRAKLLVIASKCPEAFPLVLGEAFAFGVPVLAPRLGAFEELLGSSAAGRLFAAGDAQSLHAAAGSMWTDAAGLERMSAAARAEFESRYTAGANLTALHAIYERAIERRRSA